MAIMARADFTILRGSKKRIPGLTASIKTAGRYTMPATHKSTTMATLSRMNSKSPGRGLSPARMKTPAKRQKGAASSSAASRPVRTGLTTAVTGSDTNSRQ